MEESMNRPVGTIPEFEPAVLAVIKEWLSQAMNLFQSQCIPFVPRTENPANIAMTSGVSQTMARD